MLFGLSTKVKAFFIRKEVESEVKDINMGKLGSIAKSIWDFLNGKKTVIMALVGTSEILLKSSGHDGPLTYIDAVVNGLGWSSVAPAIDPAQLALAAGTVLAVGHKIYKSYQDSKSAK